MRAKRGNLLLEGGIDCRANARNDIHRLVRIFGQLIKLSYEYFTAEKRGGLVVDIDIIFRIAGIGLLISVLCIVLKQAQKQEQAEMLTLAGVVVVLIIVVQLMNQLFSVVRTVFNM